MYRRYYSFQCCVRFQRNGVDVKYTTDTSSTKQVYLRVWHVKTAEGHVNPVWNEANPPYIEIFQQQSNSPLVKFRVDQVTKVMK